MPDSNGSESPLEAAAGAAGPEATEAFSVLGDETRLSILLGLWEVYEPLGDENAVSFSALRERVGMRDSGQFNYHLGQLTGRFVRAADAGYELRESGQRLVRTVIAGTGIEATAVSPTALDLTCHRCGAHPVELRYADGRVYLTCSDCEGFITHGDFPAGTIAMWDLDPAGVADREASELLVASAVAQNNRLRMMMAGVCPDCSGTIDSALRICEEHQLEDGAVCPHCETRDSARVRYLCTVCKNWDEAPVQVGIHDHPAVISFYYERGVDIRFDTTDIGGFSRVWELLWEQDHRVVSMDPVRVRVTVPCDGDELQLSLDANLDVIDVTEDS